MWVPQQLKHNMEQVVLCDGKILVRNWKEAEGGRSLPCTWSAGPWWPAACPRSLCKPSPHWPSVAAHAQTHTHKHTHTHTHTTHNTHTQQGHPQATRVNVLDESRGPISDWGLSSPHLLAHVDLGEAERAEMSVGASHRWLNRLSEQLVHKLTDKRPHLFHRLKDRKAAKIGPYSQISKTKRIP